MLKKYLIRAGFTFLAADNTVVTGGEQIELEDDVARDHLHKLEELEPPEKAARKASSGKKTPDEGGGQVDPYSTPAGAFPGDSDPAAGADNTAADPAAAGE